MYIPKDFEVSDKHEIINFMEANSFGQLISNVSGRLFSTHMPFMLTPDKLSLLGHLAIKNPQHNDINGQEVLITLEGAHDYISPSWYETAGVPTWNYQAVHIYGVCKVFDSTERLQKLVDALTVKYEASRELPWQPEYNPSMLKSIIGIEVMISQIQCKYKLSQNRSYHDRMQVIKNLKANGSNKLADAMVRNEL